MSDNNSTDTTTTFDIDDLDALSANLFGQEEVAKPAEEPASSEETAEAEEPETDGDDEVETEESDSDSEDAPEEPVDEKPKKGGRFQERINELTTARREAERREQDAINRIAALEARLANPQTEDTKDTKAPAKENAPSAPTPTDKNDDGSDKYELGEFDPKFVRDLTRFEVAEATREQRESDARERADRDLDAKAAELGRQWESKLAPAQERYPDYHEKAKTLEPIFANLDKSYGEYLAQTLMTMDHGPDVLYYLAEHPEEARTLVNSGATRATIQLGRLESRFVEQEQPQPTKEKRVTKAPTPPAHQNKGTGGSKVAVPDDTDDLDAFASKFYSRK